MKTEADIWSMVEPYLAAEHLELDDLELLGSGKGRTVRVVVDGEGVNVDRLADVARGISRLLDSGQGDDFQLEVSSPGLERKLRKPAHFIKSVGREVKAKVRMGEANTTLSGVITDATDIGFTVDVAADSHIVPYEDVLTAKTVFRWEKPPKPGR